MADVAGRVGLHPSRGDEGRIHNIGWTSVWDFYGWTGAHTAGTNEPFVQRELSRHILHKDPESCPWAGTPVDFQKAEPSSQAAVQVLADT